MGRVGGFGSLRDHRAILLLCRESCRKFCGHPFLQDMKGAFRRSPVAIAGAEGTRLPSFFPRTTTGVFL
jgi:hypothetical protein